MRGLFDCVVKSSSREKRSCSRPRNTSLFASWNTTVKAARKNICATSVRCCRCRATNWISPRSPIGFNGTACKRNGNWFQEVQGSQNRERFHTHLLLDEVAEVLEFNRQVHVV